MNDVVRAGLRLDALKLAVQLAHIEGASRACEDILALARRFAEFVLEQQPTP